MTLGCCKGEIKVFNSLYTSLVKDTPSIILNLFQFDGHPKFEIVKTQKQEGGMDCGLFTVAIATALAFGSSPFGFEQSGMREHLKCFKDGLMAPFWTA